MWRGRQGATHHVERFQQFARTVAIAVRLIALSAITNERGRPRTECGPPTGRRSPWVLPWTRDRGGPRPSGRRHGHAADAVSITTRASNGGPGGCERTARCAPTSSRAREIEEHPGERGFLGGCGQPTGAAPARWRRRAALRRRPRVGVIAMGSSYYDHFQLTVSREPPHGCPRRHTGRALATARARSQTPTFWWGQRDHGHRDDAERVGNCSRSSSPAQNGTASRGGLLRTTNGPRRRTPSEVTHPRDPAACKGSSVAPRREAEALCRRHSGQSSRSPRAGARAELARRSDGRAGAPGKQVQRIILTRRQSTGGAARLSCPATLWPRSPYLRHPLTRRALT